MLKIEKEYEEKYKDIPSSPTGRIGYLLNHINLSRYKESIFDRIKEISSIKWKKYEYTIYLLPKATPRPRAGKYGVFYVKGAKNNKKIFSKYLIDVDYSMIFTPCKFTCRTYYPIPSSMSNQEKILAELGYIRPITEPDWDNVAKAYCDMIQDTILYNDSLIIDGSSSKFYSVKPRIEVVIEYMDEYDSKFNKNKIMNKGKVKKYV